MPSGGLIERKEFAVNKSRSSVADVQRAKDFYTNFRQRKMLLLTLWNAAVRIQLNDKVESYLAGKTVDLLSTHSLAKMLVNWLCWQAGQQH